MNQFLSLFNIFILLSAINFIRGEDQEMALLFNMDTSAIINPINSPDDAICVNCAAACPFQSTSNEETAFNNKYSISKKSIYVKDVYMGYHSMKDINLKICKTSFELVVVYNKITNEIEFGYEIYYDKSVAEYQPIKKISSYNIYGPITDLQTEPMERGLISRVRSFTKSLSLSKDEPKVLLEDTKMQLLWIPVFKLSYNGEYKSPNRITHETSLKIPNSSKTCQNYDLGAELYEDINMVEIYEKENLDEIFKNTITPVKDETNAINNIAEEMVVDGNQVCITRWNLIQEKYFHFYSPNSLSCSYLTTVPVWCYLADELLKPLDEYIEVLNDIMPETLKITSGTNETLRMCIKTDKSLKNKFSLSRGNPVRMYLSNHKKSNQIPIPASIYKVIEYESTKCSEENQNNCSYSIFIEIHNAPYFKTAVKICEENENACGEWGWKSFFQNDDVKSKYVSCCETTPEIEKKIKLPMNENDERPPKKIFDLNKYNIENSNAEVGFKSLKELADEIIERKHEV